MSNAAVIPLVSATSSVDVPHVTVRTTCPYCGVGCGVEAVCVTALGDARRGAPEHAPENKQQNAQAAMPEIRGDALHPANAGRLCVKGAALGETLGLEERLLAPAMRTRNDVMETPRTVSWDTALDAVADGFRAVIAEHGPDAVAFYVSGQLLTEDYYVANKLMKGFIGSANIDTNSRLCMSSAVAGHKRAFGEDVVPVCYDDLEAADLIVLVGSNAAWCHPVLFQRIARLKEQRPAVRVVVVDPRHTATCELADLHVALKPGSDVWLFNGLLSYLADRGLTDRAFVGAHTHGVAEALVAAAADGGDIESVARTCKLAVQTVRRFYEMFAATGRVVTVFSQGVNQSSSGTDKVNSIINCHLLTGRIGKPGAGPFSITGQPNAMGGREVGGLANMLAAHLELDNAAHRALVQDFWGAPCMAVQPGLKAVPLFEAIEAGRVKAIWIMGTNPVVSMPEADRVRAALARCELVVVSDVMARTDTADLAHVLLPALAWGEKDGTVTNSERRISRQRPFLPPPGAARADWDLLCDVARRMGYRGFDYPGPHAIFDEHARLSTVGNGTGGVAPRQFNLAGLTGLSRAAYDALASIQWPVPCPATGTGPTGTARLYADGRFSHADGRARFVPVRGCWPAHGIDNDYPLVLNTGRVRDHWHTMTRTGKVPRLAGHTSEAAVDMHPHDALLCGVREGELARVRSRWGAMVARVRHGGGMPRGSVFVPIHWNAQFASDARVGAVVNAAVDAVSGEPEFKHTPVQVEPFPVSWHAFVLTRTQELATPATYWTRIQGRQFVRYELAGREAIADAGAWARALLDVKAAGAEWLEYEDATAGVYRAACVVAGRLEACVFLSPRPDLPARTWLSVLMENDALATPERASLLAGEPLEAGTDTGQIVCACFGVGRETICRAIRQHGLSTAAEVTACIKAGGNCGSCVPEIGALLLACHAVQAA
ncbi:molybdopterin-dependent oxidoreductase [Imbroritus primus]|uniref:molybdopterin-dependent oxidoreductase n=1 Tax=Imbroritus primus TaxID=3058603 RepID=UPI003D160742